MGSAPYRTSRGAPPDPYLAAWAEYRNRRQLKWAVLVVPAVAPFLLPAWLRGADDSLLQFVCVVVALGALATMGWLGLFACPRCSARMYVRGAGSDGDADGCRSCGLRVGTPKYPPLP